MSDITLSAGVRQNLLSLQNTSDLMAQTQNRLATGKEVNSALDNPSNFFTSESLQSRANDMSSLLDSMANGVKTLEAADNGLQSITKTLESMESTLRQARQDKSFQTESYTLADSGLGSGDQISFSGGAVGETAVDVNLTKETAGTSALSYDATDEGVAWDPADTVTFDIDVDGGGTASISIGQATVQGVGNGDNAIDSIDEFEAAVTAAIDAEGTYASGTDFTISNDGTDITISSASTGTSSSVDVTNIGDDGAGNITTNFLSGATNTAGAADGGDAYTVDELVSLINGDSSLEGKIRASNDDGQLRIENQSTQVLDVDGVDSTGTVDGSSTDAATIDGNSVRSGLADQFNELKDQLDKLSDDASYNGINLLRGDNLKITFNETGTSTIDIQTEDGETINSANLGLESIEAADLDSDANIDGFLQELKAATDDIASQSSTFGSNLSIVENRQDFTNNMVNTLETGSDNLVLADMNQEAANMTALQTRQQLSSSALSLASQADQNVLQLIR